jgi:hypothetical protein
LEAPNLRRFPYCSNHQEFKGLHRKAGEKNSEISHNSCIWSISRCQAKKQKNVKWPTPESVSPRSAYLAVPSTQFAVNLRATSTGCGWNACRVQMEIGVKKWFIRTLGAAGQ